MRRFKLILGGTAALGLSALTGACGFSPPQNASERLTLATCRSEADRIYNVRNRAQLSERSSTDSPFSGAAQPGLPSDGLADRYSHERMVDDCVRQGAAGEQ